MADKCEAYRALIEEAAGGAGAGAGLRAHLDSCGPCREFRRGREALVGLVGGLEKVSAPDDFEFRLRARMAARRGTGRAPLWRLRFAPGLAAAAVAACLLAAAPIYFRTDPPAGTNVAVRQTAPPAAAVDVAADAGPAARAAVESKPSDTDARRRPQEAPRARAVAAAFGAGKRGADRPRRPAREDNFSARAAAVIEGDVAGSARPTARPEVSRGVALRTSPESLRVVMRDERGGSYVLPMRSVSFGALAPVGRGARAARASYTDRGGVW